ncbi:autotransporter outer membrane beta-barrel domain-containing protein [Prosthecochloris sp. HL-130-GSB]|uniref:autotransporter outer membrane beta-barrel domain-containing protein n=1 Tax=Prosthecochloris sp. HL-130-GSB TaxID=1974213 RepID=UPI0012F49D33|nr:autotransporter outer membrane beta-barrel domain-containing protein [Prosthecochloris sp. HL-130-GSB]
MDHRGVIKTDGHHAAGIMAQSFGGGGGNAGMDFIYDKTNKASVALAIGREGGQGGDGGDVELWFDGKAKTVGDYAYGLLAQSAGNGGGNSSSISGGVTVPGGEQSGDVTMQMAIGLQGAEGGTGGSALIDADGWVWTQGDNAHALFAQSIGGGGGNGGMATSPAIFSSTYGLAIGGTGGLGGRSDSVVVRNSATVLTEGESALGILAQSIGGGGGNGGMAIGGGLQTSGGGALALVGGSGGTGAVSDDVDVENDGRIETLGSRSHGIVAQSLGGGGGNAGMVINEVINKSKTEVNQVSVSVGGNGGEGNDAGDVTVENSGIVNTSGGKAVGILAQSVGGGGGDASTVINGSVAVSGPGNSIGLGIGGSGGTGGTGGDVDVRNIPDGEGSGVVSTTGDGSHGIFALSVGGGGGTGSTVVNAGVSRGAGDQASSNSFGLAIGGSGGSGGKAGTVHVSNEGTIVTEGREAHGIVAESIGGGGGNGGMAFSGSMVLGSTVADNVTSNIAIGGSGGDGNDGNSVIVDNSGYIATSGDGSYGIFAQSVGGGGGNGAFALSTNLDPSTIFTQPLKSSMMNIAVGGLGGAGGDGGDVVVNHTGSMLIEGDNAYGIFAQSVGGGGGSAALSISSPVWTAADMAIPLLLGGKDGSNGTGGKVEVNAEGSIVTTGNNSQALFYQSVAGGGGDVQLYMDISKDASDLGPGSLDGLEEKLSVIENIQEKVAFFIGLGSEDGDGNNGSDMNGSHEGDLQTLGNNSSSLVLQSIGGGGGSSLIDLLSRDQADIFADVVLGGSSNQNSRGGSIGFDLAGDVRTSGDLANGLMLQSIGGGGGLMNIVLNRVEKPGYQPASVSRAAGPVSLLSAPVVPAAVVDVTLGASGGSGLHGGDIDIDLTGDVSTSADRSIGLIQQSIGAGGGLATATGADHLNVTIGATDEAEGNGGDISLEHDGAVFTEGALSHGVLLQSIGGGGGLVLTDNDPADISLALRDANTGNGGDISFIQHGDIIATGDNTYGVIAQSLGGGGGMVDLLFAGTAGGEGTSGAVNLSLSGDVLATGENGVAVYAESSANDGRGNISITLEGEQVLGGTGERARAVSLVGGARNSLENHALLATMDGLEGMAVSGTGGDDHVVNYGTMVGNVDLGSGANYLQNTADAFLYSGELLGVGTGNRVQNDGYFSVGLVDSLMDTRITGDFLQTADAMLHTTLDFDANRTDHVAASGSADVDGELELFTIKPWKLMPGSHQSHAVTGADGLDDRGIELVVKPSAVVDYSLAYPDAQSLDVAWDVDFAPDGLSPNQHAIGDYFNRLQLSGGAEPMYPHVTWLFNLPDFGSLQAAYEELIADEYFTYSEAAMNVTRQHTGFISRRMSALQAIRNGGTASAFVPGEPFLYASNDEPAGAAVSPAPLKPATGVWFNGSGLSGERDSEPGFAGYEYDAKGVAAGFDISLGDRGVVGYAIGADWTDLENGLGQGDGEIFSRYFSMYGGLLTEGFSFDAMLSYAEHDFSGRRFYDGFGEAQYVTSEHDGHSWSLFGELGYSFETGRWVLKPFASLHYMYLREQAFREYGAEELDLIVKSRTTESLVSDLGIRLHGEYHTGAGIFVPELSASWQHDFTAGDAEHLTAAFAGVPDLPFTITGSTSASNGASLGAALGLYDRAGSGFSARYNTLLHEDRNIHQVSAELKIAF